ncbi:MAG TPA: DUF2637 domain-containing protein [Mycobacterium sp.]|nr:DUF2637 domain-containing protein [Mycobacterium sp.]
MSRLRPGLQSRSVMTTLADPPTNGAELDALEQSAFITPISTNSSRNDSGEQAVVRVTRAAAVLITVVIGAASFVLSFSSLWDLAARSAWPTRLAWLWPVIVDCTIILATMAIVALASYRHQRSNRRFFWAVLCAAAVVSVNGNAVHAVIPAQRPWCPGCRRGSRACRRSPCWRPRTRWRSSGGCVPKSP